jgi:hypothetical protein
MTSAVMLGSGKYECHGLSDDIVQYLKFIPIAQDSPVNNNWRLRKDTCGRFACGDTSEVRFLLAVTAALKYVRRGTTNSAERYQTQNRSDAMHIPFALKLLGCVNTTQMLDKPTDALANAIHIPLTRAKNARVVSVWRMALDDQAGVHLKPTSLYHVIANRFPDLERPDILLRDWNADAAVWTPTDAHC